MTQNQIMLALENERERLGISTMDLAVRAGVSPGTIYMCIENRVGDIKKKKEREERNDD